MYDVTFYGTIVFTIIGALLGLTGLWIDDFFQNDAGWKLVATDIILAVSCAIIATITKLLG